MINLKHILYGSAGIMGLVMIFLASRGVRADHGTFLNTLQLIGIFSIPPAITIIYSKFAKDEVSEQ